MVVRTHPSIWILRLALVVLPFTSGDAMTSAAHDRSSAVRLCLEVLAWSTWAIAFVASVIAHPRTLTALRVSVPALAVGAVWAAIEVRDTIGFVGATAAMVAAMLSLSAYVADEFIDAPSYGDERRFSIRAPAALLFGPIPLAWLVTVTGIATGPLLLAAKSWVIGSFALAVGWAAASMAVRSLHSLALRFVVFVPAGMTLVDPLILVDSVLFARARIVRLGPALSGTTALDLSQKAPGLVLEVSSGEPIEITMKEGRRTAAPTNASAVLFTPARPGALLAEAGRRRIPVG